MRRSPYCETHRRYHDRDNNDHELRCYRCYDDAETARNLARYDASRLAWQTTENHMTGAALVCAIKQAGGVVRVPRVALDDPKRHMARLRTSTDCATNDLVLTIDLGATPDAVDPHGPASVTDARPRATDLLSSDVFADEYGFAYRIDRGRIS